MKAWLIGILLMVSVPAWADHDAAYECVYFGSFARAATYARDGKLSPKAKNIKWYLTRLEQEAPAWEVSPELLDTLKNIAIFLYNHPEIDSDAAFALIYERCMSAVMGQTGKEVSAPVWKTAVC